MAKKYFNVLRYNPVFSKLILFCVWPIMQIGYFSNWLKYRVKINGGSVSYNGYTLLFPKNVGVNVLSKIYWFGDSGFEKHFGKYMVTALQRSTLFLDIGSNFGFYSVLATKANPDLFSYCFEPVDFLQEDNLLFHKLNAVSRYQLVDKALGDADGTSTIFIPSQRDLKFLITSATLSHDFADQKGFGVIKKEIEIIKLDTFVDTLTAGENLKTDSRMVIKIDVEGFEYQVLKGAVNVFTTYKPIVFIEIFLTPENIEGIMDFLNQVEYNLFAFSEIGLVWLDKSALYRYKGERNFIFLSKAVNTNRFLTFPDFEEIVSPKRI